MPASAYAALIARSDALSGQVLVAEGQAHRERRTLPEGALQRDVATVQAYELLHQGEPDTRSFVCAGTRSLDAMKALEDVWQVRGADAGAGVGHGEHDLVLLPRNGHGNAPFQGELVRIREQVEDDLFPHVPVDKH